MDSHTTDHDRDRPHLQGGELGARTRLEQAHDHWHRTQSAYPFSDRFLLNTNALIPSLRSVTFVLQKNLRHREGFAEWYALWRERMKSDPVMRWVVQARNHIEKIGDLELRSTARVSVVASWLDAPFQESDVPPLMPPHLIADAISRRGLPDRIRKEGVLRVERRWVAPDLPNWEILDACSYAWGFLDGLLADAEAVFLGGQSDPDPSQVRRRDCMSAGPDARTASLHLESGDFIAYESIPHQPSEADFADVEKRYGDAIRAIPRPNDTLRSQVRWFHEMARLFLKRDGHAQAVAFIRRHGKTIRTVSLDPEDQQDKYLLMDKLARIVDSTGADQFVFTSEVWVAPYVPPDDPRFDLRPRDREDRGEGLSTIGVDRSGEIIDLESRFSRQDNDIVLSEAQEAIVPVPLSMGPILRIWGINTLPPDSRIEFR